MENIKFKADVVYGHVALKAWVEIQGDRLVGMGSCTVYNKDGGVVSTKVEPTGLVATFQ